MISFRKENISINYFNIINDMYDNIIISIKTTQDYIKILPFHIDNRQLRQYYTGYSII